MARVLFSTRMTANKTVKEIKKARRNQQPQQQP